MVLIEKSSSSEIGSSFKEAVQDIIMTKIEDGTLIFTDQTS